MYKDMGELFNFVLCDGIIYAWDKQGNEYYQYRNGLFYRTGN